MANPKNNDLSRFSDVQNDRPQYKPDEDKCRKTPLIGYLLTKIVGLPFPKGHERAGETWDAYVIETTAPCYAQALEDENPREYPAGTEVMIGESAKLAKLTEFLDTQKVFEIFVEVGQKAKLSGGRTMWLFNIKRNKKPESFRPRDPMVKAVVFHTSGEVSNQRIAELAGISVPKQLNGTQSEMPF